MERCLEHPTMFHDAPIVTFEGSPNEVVLTTDPFSFSDTETRAAARIRITGIRRTFCNDRVVIAAQPPTGFPPDSGEILTLHETAGAVTLVICWRATSPPREDCSAFRFDGAQLMVETAFDDSR